MEQSNSVNFLGIEEWMIPSLLTQFHSNSNNNNNDNNNNNLEISTNKALSQSVVVYLKKYSVSVEMGKYLLLPICSFV